ncbi:D-alanyl-D-alanine carboxypeptidase family protein [Candidatus Midichloria mitochondrii]|nr:D-alanyl-D-alanine carboxypeptidase family protein [Candidatus Midichloria mitochondrii]
MVRSFRRLQLVILVLSVFTIRPLSALSINHHNFIYSSKYASLIVNSDNGKVIHSHNAKMIRYPASLAKIMTIYILFDEIKKGKIHPNHIIKISRNAASQPRTNLNLRPGTKIKVKEAILALIVRSANDVAVGIAEAISGSEENFARLMNTKARLLGMKNTVFCNASGLPDRRQVTTAHDMAILALAMQRNHAQFYHLFSRTSFKFGNQIIKSHNHVLRKNKWVDGMKTGYINDSGFNIITTAKRPEGRLIAVVMGGNTAASRDYHTLSLLETAYRSISTKAPIKKPIITTNYQEPKKSAPKKQIKVVATNKPKPNEFVARKPDIFGVLQNNQTYVVKGIRQGR